MVRLQAAFKDLNGNLVDPSTVEVVLSPPNADDTIVTTGIIKDSVGNYHYDWIGTVKGNWTIRWQGLGAVVVANLPYVIRLV
jgi:hypothetical protein